MNAAALAARITSTRHSRRTAFILRLTEADRDRLTAHLSAGAARVDVLPEHWITNDENCESYCYECAQKKVVELLSKNPDGEYDVDGGWGVEGDSQAFCATCDKTLQNSFTHEACESEVRHYLAEGFNPASDDDCYAMERVIGSSGWEPFQERDKPYYVQLDELGRRILALLGPQEPAAASEMLPQGL